MNTQFKIVKLPTLKKKIVQYRRRRKIVFTNGCFDILHAGHISYLQKAKNNDRVLIIGLNSDVSVKKIKGSKRPIMKEQERALILSALECVDYVTLFNEETPIKLIESIKPDILVKGADWKNKGIIGSESVLKNGGRIEYIKYVSGYSSTNVIKRIKSRG